MLLVKGTTMSDERLFLVILGGLVVVTRSVGLVSPKTFAGLVMKLLEPRVFGALSKPWGIVVLGAGVLGLYLSWGICTVQGIVVVVLSVFFVAVALALLSGRLNWLRERATTVLSDTFLCRLLCALAVVIGLLLVCLAIA
jgi:hypothetical protein